jgi:hypothetical protein
MPPASAPSASLPDAEATPSVQPPELKAAGQAATSASNIIPFHPPELKAAGAPPIPPPQPQPSPTTVTPTQPPMSPEDGVSSLLAPTPTPLAPDNPEDHLNPTQQSLNAQANNPMALTDDENKAVIQNSLAGAPQTITPPDPPPDPLPPPPKGGFPPPEIAAAQPTQQKGFPPPELATQPESSPYGKDLNQGPEFQQAQEQQRLDDAIKPYDGNPDKIAQAFAHHQIDDFQTAQAMILHAQMKDQMDASGGLKSETDAEQFQADWQKTVQDAKNAINWLGGVLSSWRDAFIHSPVEIPGQLFGAAANIGNIVAPSNAVPGVPEAPNASQAEAEGISAALAPKEAGGTAPVQPKYDNDKTSPVNLEHQTVTDLNRERAERALVAGTEEGTAQFTEWAENSISHLIGLSSTAPNAVLKLLGGPEIGYIDPRFQAIMASRGAPIRSDKSYMDMDPKQMAAQLYTDRMQSGLHAARSEGYVGQGTQQMLNAFAGRTVDTPEGYAAKGFPIPLKAIQDTAATANLGEGMVGLGLVGRLAEAAGITSVLNSSVQATQRSIAGGLENMAQNMHDFQMPPVATKIAKGLVGTATKAIAGHYIGQTLGIPGPLAAVAAGMFKMPLVDYGVDLIAGGAGNISKATSFLASHAADAMRLAADNSENLLATRSAAKQILVTGMQRAGEGMMGMTPALLGAKTPQDIGSLLGMGTSLGLLSHAVPDAAAIAQNRLADSAFITDTNWGQSRKPADPPTPYGTNKALDEAHEQALNSLDPATGKPMFSNAQKHLINQTRTQANGMSEIYVLNPKPYAAEMERMQNLGWMNDPVMNSRGVAIDPNPGQNQARVLVRADAFDDAFHHELAHPIISRMELGNPQDLSTFFQAFSRTNDPNDFTSDYTSRATLGQQSATYDQLPSQTEINNGTGQFVPGLRGMTKEDMQREMATEALSGLLKGGSIRDLTRDPTMFHQTQQAFWRVLDDMGFNPTTTRSNTVLGLRQSIQAAMVLEPLVRDTLRRNLGQGAGAPPVLDRPNPNARPNQGPDLFNQPNRTKGASTSTGGGGGGPAPQPTSGTPAPENATQAPQPPPKAQRPGPNVNPADVIKGLRGVGWSAADAKKAAQTTAGETWEEVVKNAVDALRDKKTAERQAGKPAKETPADIAKQALMSEKGFTPEEAEKHVQNDATNAVEAIRNAVNAKNAELPPDVSLSSGKTIKPEKGPIEPRSAGLNKAGDLYDFNDGKGNWYRGLTYPEVNELVGKIPKEGKVTSGPTPTPEQPKETPKQESEPPKKSETTPPPAETETPKGETKAAEPETTSPKTGTPEEPKSSGGIPIPPTGTPQGPVTPTPVPQGPVPPTPQPHAGHLPVPPGTNVPQPPTTGSIAGAPETTEQQQQQKTETPTGETTPEPKEPQETPETTTGTARVQKHLRQQGVKPGTAQRQVHRAMKGEAPVPMAPHGHANIGAFGYPGDYSWDHNSLRGVGAGAHVQKPGSMIPGYSAGLTLEGARARGLHPINGAPSGEEFIGEDGKTYRWDDTAPSDFDMDGKHHHVAANYIDVYDPNHAPDPGVSAAQIESNARYMAQFGIGSNGQRGPLVPGQQPVGPVDFGEQVVEHATGTEPPKGTQGPATAKGATEGAEPAAKSSEPVTAQSIQEAEDRAHEQVVQGERQSDEAYTAAIQKQVLQTVGEQHAASLAPDDQRVKYDPASGLLTGKYFDPIDPFHQWLLNGTNQKSQFVIKAIQNAIPEGQDLWIDYNSAPQKAKGLATAAQRQEAQIESGAHARAEGTAPGQQAGKNIVPSYVGVSLGKEGAPNSLYYGGISPDKVASNAQQIAHRLGPESPYKSGPAGDPVDEEDMRGYLHNISNGWKGDGSAKLTPTEGANLPVESPGFEPYTFGNDPVKAKSKADFWNLAVQGKGAGLSGKDMMDPGTPSGQARALALGNEGYVSGETKNPKEVSKAIAQGRSQQIDEAEAKRDAELEGQAHKFEVLQAIQKHGGLPTAKRNNQLATSAGGMSYPKGEIADLHEAWKALDKDSKAYLKKNYGITSEKLFSASAEHPDKLNAKVSQTSEVPYEDPGELINAAGDALSELGKHQIPEIKSSGIREGLTNPLHAKIEAETPGWTKETLHSGYERLLADNTIDILPSGEDASEQIHPGHEAIARALKEGGYPPSGIVKAGFMPGETEAERAGKPSEERGSGMLAPASGSDTLTLGDRLKKNEHLRANLEKQQAKLDTTNPEEDKKWDELATRIHGLEEEHSNLRNGGGVAFMPAESAGEEPNEVRKAREAWLTKGTTENAKHRDFDFGNEPFRLTGEEQKAVEPKKATPSDQESGQMSMFMPGDVVEGPGGERERIQSPAVRINGVIHSGSWHGEAIDNARDSGEPISQYNEHLGGHEIETGYLTTTGNFVTQGSPGWELAKRNNQIKASSLAREKGNAPQLASEDLKNLPKTRGPLPERPSAQFMPGDDRDTVRLFRASRDSEARTGAHFSESREHAKAYTKNPGFGGPNLYEATVPVDKDRVLDVSGDPSWRRLSSVYADIHNQGIEDPEDRISPDAKSDEWMGRGFDQIHHALDSDSDLRDALAKKYNWVKFTDSYPEGAKTWRYLGEKPITTKISRYISPKTRGPLLGSGPEASQSEPRSAAFMPGDHIGDAPEKIKDPAVRTPDGKIYTGNIHKFAEGKALKDNPALGTRDLVAGYTTDGGRFLSLRDAMNEIKVRPRGNKQELSSEDIRYNRELKSPAFMPSERIVDHPENPQVQSHDFKEWFKGSKVTDQDGKPLRLYHGTTQDYDTHDPRLGNTSADWGRGIYMSNNPEDASANYTGEGREYEGREHGGHASIQPLYASLKQPVEIGGLNPTRWNTSDLNDYRQAVRDVYDKHGLGGEQDMLDQTLRHLKPGDHTYAGNIIDKMRNSRAMHQLLEDDGFQHSSGAVAAEVLRAMGHDGIIDHEPFEKWGGDDYQEGMPGLTHDTTHVIAFDPKSVKSATGNRGTFSPGSGNVNFMPADRVTKGANGNNVRETSDYDGTTSGDEMVRYRTPPATTAQPSEREETPSESAPSPPLQNTEPPDEKVAVNGHGPLDSNTDHSVAFLPPEKMPAEMRSKLIDTDDRVAKLAYAQQKAKEWLENNKPPRMSAEYSKGQLPKGKLNWKVENLGDWIESKNGKLDLNDPKVRNQMARAATYDVMKRLSGDASGLDWYDKIPDEAVKYVAQHLDPSIDANRENRMMYRLGLAVTSNGQNVYNNAETAYHAYQYWKDHGELPTDPKDFVGGGVKIKAMISSFQKLNALKDKLGAQGLEDLLDKKMTVRQMRDYGLDISGEAPDHPTYAALSLGPKIGQFYSALGKHFDALVMDMWFKRTMNRMTGGMFRFSPTAFKSQVGELGRSIRSGEVEMPDEQKAKILDEIDAIQNHEDMTRAQAIREMPELDSWAKNTDKEAARPATDPDGTKRSYPVEKRTPTTYLAKNIKENLHFTDDAPTQAERPLYREIMEKVLKNLKSAGIDMHMADAQAVLWFVEQQLYKEAGAAKKGSHTSDYLDGAYALVKQQLEHPGKPAPAAPKVPKLPKKKRLPALAGV